MIVILCNSFEEAQDSYDQFVSFLDSFEPWSIKETYNAAYCVETDDDLRYIFIDRRLNTWFQLFDHPDEIDEYYFGVGR